MCAGAGDHKGTKAGDRGDHRGEVGGNGELTPSPLRDGRAFGCATTEARARHGRTTLLPRTKLLQRSR
ncbi:hypothetical protein BHM03_00020832 [Ensete ventricosum]|nr:hypothetical protein BHM03_00020832 [Ensete ventricosum]